MKLKIKPAATPKLPSREESAAVGKLIGQLNGASRRTVAPADVALPWARGVKNVVDQFIGWLPWKERTQLLLPSGEKVIEYQGVYLFAEFGESATPDAASYKDEAIFYVGETGRRLGQRWYDYERTRWFEGVWGKSAAKVWVAAFPTWIGDDERITPEPLTKQFRLYIERSIIWEHVSKGRSLLNVR